MTKMGNCMQIIMKSCKSVELYAKVGGVRQQHVRKSVKSVKHSSKMASGGLGLEAGSA